MTPPIRARLHTGVFFQNGGIWFISIVYTWRESAGFLRVTGSLLHLVLACRLAVLCECSSCNYLQVPRFRIDALKQIVCVVGDINRLSRRTILSTRWHLRTVSQGLTERGSTSEFMCKSH